MKLKKEVQLNDPEIANELMSMFVDHFEHSIKDINSYEELTIAEKEIIPKWLFDRIVEPKEEVFLDLQKVNLNILTRLGQIIDQFPYLRFHQILQNFQVCEDGIDQFYEESATTLKKLNQNIRELKIN